MTGFASDLGDMVRLLLVFAFFFLAVPAQAEILDVDLYQQVAEKVSDGEGYYDASNELHRQNGYPTSPFVTVRPPLLAHINAALGPWGSLAALYALLGAIVWAWCLRMETKVERYVFGLTIAFFGLSHITFNSPYVHEIWAGFLITLALGLKDWRARLGLGLLAVLLRELALPFLFLLLVFGQGRKYTAMAIVAAAIYYAAHAYFVSLQPAGLASQGWLGFRGPQGFIDDMVHLSLLRFAPALAWPWFIAALAGWAVYAKKDPMPLLWCGGVLGAVVILARPDNLFWVYCAFPLFLAGPAMLLRPLLSRITPSTPRPPQTA